MNKNDLEVVGVRRESVVAGYVQPQDLIGGKCGDHMHCFDKGIVLAKLPSIRKLLIVSPGRDTVLFPYLAVLVQL